MTVVYLPLQVRGSWCSLSPWLSAMIKIDDACIDRYACKIDARCKLWLNVEVAEEGCGSHSYNH